MEGRTCLSFLSLPPLSIPDLNGIPVMGALVPKLFELVLGQAAVLLVDLAGLAPRVFPPVPLPQEGVDEDAHTDHAERDAVAADVTRGVGGRVDEGGHDA